MSSSSEEDLFPSRLSDLAALVGDTNDGNSLVNLSLLLRLSSGDNLNRFFFNNSVMDYGDDYYADNLTCEHGSTLEEVVLYDRVSFWLENVVLMAVAAVGLVLNR